MIFNMTDPNPPIRFFLDDGEDEKKDSWIDIRHAPVAILEKIRKATHTKKMKNVGGIVHEFYDVKEELYRRKLWEYCIPAWGNILDEKKKPIPYSVDNLIWLMDNNIHFNKIISDKMEEVEEEAKKRFEALEKN